MLQHKKEIERLIRNGYSETHVGYHAEYRNWKGEWVRGCYAQIAAPYGGTIRIYAPSYAKLMIAVREYLAGA
jgi:hypothetical protein